MCYWRLLIALLPVAVNQTDQVKNIYIPPTVIHALRLFINYDCGYLIAYQATMYLWHGCLPPHLQLTVVSRELIVGVRCIVKQSVDNQV